MTRPLPTLVTLGDGIYGHVPADAGYRTGERISMDAYRAATAYHRTGKLKAVPQMAPRRKADGWLRFAQAGAIVALLVLAWVMLA